MIRTRIDDIHLLPLQYIRNTFTDAKDNITVNGMDTREMEEELAKASEGEGEHNLSARDKQDCQLLTGYFGTPELEPFDTQLAQRIQSLSAQIEHQTLQLANLRRKAPGETARKFEEAFVKQSEDYEARIGQARERRMKEAGETKVGPDGELQRTDEMQASWMRGREELEQVKSGIGGTIEKMEKAKRAVEVVREE